MSFYGENEGSSWSALGRQPSWEQQAPPSRSGATSAMSHQSDSTAFASQFEEIDRATDNLMKSGKWLPPANAPAGAPQRRDSLPAAGRSFDYSSDPRSAGGGGGGPQRQQSVGSDYEAGRPGSSGLQGYYQGQRFPGGRQSEAEQMLQAKRRMAAQRERELRNYHQEQQYNRNVAGAKPERAMSPNTMSEDDRRELIARQHRALYGDNSSLYGQEAAAAAVAGGPRPQSQDVRASSVSGRGVSPLAFDPFGMPGQRPAEGAVQMPPRDTAASPTSTGPPQYANMLADAQPNARASASSPSTSTSPPHSQQKPGLPPGVAPIGTRPAPTAAPGLGKRSTTPLTPSALSHGFNAEMQAPGATAGKNERSGSAASNPALAADKNVGGLGGGWGANSGVWGGGKGLAVQGSVWG